MRFVLNSSFEKENQMGSFAYLNQSGHAEFKWTDEGQTREILIDLGPKSKSKHEENERDFIFSLITSADKQGMSATYYDEKNEEITDIKLDEQLPKSVRKIKLYQSENFIRNFLEKIFNSKIVANNLIFEIDENKNATLVQKTEIKLDKQYQTVAPVRGG